MNKRSSTSWIIGFIVVGITTGIVYWINASAPKPKKKTYEERVQVVEVRAFEVGDQRPYWRSGSEVKAAHQVSLTALVSGPIEKIHDQAQPGAWLPQGTELARIDDADYENALQQQLANLIQARSELAIEKGQSALAKEELELAGTRLSKSDRALVLREPQISSATAAVKQAHAAVQQARIDLQRTHITMPFDGQIVSRSASTGSFVSSSSEIFDVVNTSEFWLEVKVPQAFMTWIDKDHTVQIDKPGIWQGQSRSGRIINVLPEVDSTDRQIKVMVAIDDPLGREIETDLPVLVNDYVEVTIWGKRLPQVQVLETGLLDAEQRIWVVDRNDTLQRRDTQVVYVGREKVWAKVDLKPGDQLLETRVAVATSGMKVKIEQPSVNLNNESSQLASPTDNAQAEGTL